MPAAGEYIDFPDVVDVSCDVLNAALPAFENVTAFGRIPKPRPAEFILVRLAGSARETMVSENYQLLLEGWAQTATRAFRLVRVARAIIFAQDAQLFGCSSISGPAELPDPTSSQERVTSMVGVRVRGTTLA